MKTAIHTISILFDPYKELTINPRLAPKIEEVRSLVNDGGIPNVRVVLCNNGQRWNDQAQTLIKHSGFGSQVQWMHCNHAKIVSVLQRKKSVQAKLVLQGKAIVEEFDFRRVLIGKLPIVQLAELFNQHGELLLERNIRRYLGLHSNRVNLAIHQTLENPEMRGNFYFFNNGITMICRKFRHSALRSEDYTVHIEDAQIINGGQTCKTIQETLNQPTLFNDYSNAFVLLRLYELADDDTAFVRDITYATNSQNPVDLRDLRSNDEQQKQLELGLSGLGYHYKRQRDQHTSNDPSVITSSVLAEATLAIWRRKPHQAKTLRREHFGKLYEQIFHQLNAAQGVLAVLILRYVDSQRRIKWWSQTDHPFRPYATHYLAMLVGEQLLREHNLALEQLDHRLFSTLLSCWQQQCDQYVQHAEQRLSHALAQLYGQQSDALSLQQLAATFRRGDLLQLLNTAPGRS